MHQGQGEKDNSQRTRSHIHQAELLTAEEWAFCLIRQPALELFESLDEPFARLCLVFPQQSHPMRCVELEEALDCIALLCF